MPTTALTAPSGWDLVTPPTTARSGRIERASAATLDRSNIEAALIELREWATTNGLKLEPADYSVVNYDNYLDVYFWTSFKLWRDADFDNTTIIGTYPCTGCGRELRVGQVYCDTCDRFVVCDNCHLAGLRLYGTLGQATAGVCPVCSVECVTSGCTNRLAASEGFDRCPTCDPRAACSGCHNLVPLGLLVQHTHNGGTYSVCEACTPGVCSECDGYFRSVVDRTIGGTVHHICDDCAQVYYDCERAAFEQWDSTELPVSGSLLIPSSSERPVRTISIETEFDGDGVAVGRALCSSGLIPTPTRDRYSAQTGDGRYPCLLKSDSSVTGGELVSYLLDLDTDNHAAALLRMTEVMRGCREMGQAQFTHRAGGHIHVDLHGLTAKDMWAQYTLFKYLELVIFHLGGAGAEYGHRTLSDSGYSDPGPNGPFTSVGEFAKRLLSGRGDRWALHFSNFAYVKDNCSCGSYITGEWASCTCNLGKATAEWRVWNAEINPRILHAWIAFTQALTAYATDFDNFEESNFPVLAWNEVPFQNNTNAVKKQVQERLEWIFRELPLTLHERDSLIYALKKSQLSALGDDFLNGLLDIVPNTAFAAKKPARNPGSRKTTAFDLAAVPGAGANVTFVDDFYAGEDEEEDYF